ncbi:UPF0764 protein C16orf89 [Caerostris darwini]|uniref:UPF0764 protein C16orf89 n=1 Tax=Caerostris darwini TaxID=1538125 RepID=A0AAV4PIJ1_9ARAC|nr:UPF0764 protein C16orf89 [Caerostris darwini]
MLLPCVLVLSYVAGALGSSRLDRALHALDRGLSFMEDRIEDINLDAVLGTRLVEEHLSTLLEFEPRTVSAISGRLVALQDKARRISEVGSQNVRSNDPDYSEAVGRVMDPSKKPLWHPSRQTSPALVLKPLPCSQSAFNETNSDTCLQEVVGTRSKRACRVSRRCTDVMSSPRQQGYILTHQVLYWQMLQMRDCVHDVPESLQMSLCSNVMRDAERIAHALYPRTHRDLFMEQIGLCGLWGFRDFRRSEWLDTILSWQQPSGCFNDRAKWQCVDDLRPDPPGREKRREKVLPDGCLSHKTTVALLAIAVNIRFEAEIHLLRSLH